MSAVPATRLTTGPAQGLSGEPRPQCLATLYPALSRTSPGSGPQACSEKSKRGWKWSLQTLPILTLQRFLRADWMRANSLHSFSFSVASSKAQDRLPHRMFSATS